jgi:hypothetical protein
MSPDTAPDERRLTPAQAEHLQRLYAVFEQAQKQLNDFAAYLLREHGIEAEPGWVLAPDLTRFVRTAPSEPEAQGR